MYFLKRTVQTIDLQHLSQQTENSLKVTKKLSEVRTTSLIPPPQKKLPANLKCGSYFRIPEIVKLLTAEWII